MSSTLAKYSETPTRSFCPLIIYHDSPSEQLAIKLNTNKYHDRKAIDRHLEKTNEMMEHNAQVWTEKISSSLVEFEADYIDKDIKVSPSTSTTSNISSSSSSSGDSIATLDNPYHTRTPVIEPVSSSPNHFYTQCSSMMEQEQKALGRKPMKSRSIASISTPSPVTATSPSTLTPPPALTDTTKKRRRGNLPKEVTEFLRKWLIQHKKHPYPAEKEKADLARHTGLTVNQISNWFINARRRILQPMLESENLTAQMIAHPELVNLASSSAGHFEPPRRRRHDFYTYQRNFGSNIPDSSMPMGEPQHHHQHLLQTHYHANHAYQHQYRNEENSSTHFFRKTRLSDANEQLSMR